MNKLHTPSSTEAGSQPSIVIKPIAHKVFDAFWGIGWDSWSRFEKKYFNGKLHLNLIKGNPMPKDAFRLLYESLEKK